MYVVWNVQTSSDIQTFAIFIRAWDWKVWEGGGGTRDTGLVTVDNLFENPARYIYVCIIIEVPSAFANFSFTRSFFIFSFSSFFWTYQLFWRNNGGLQILIIHNTSGVPALTNKFLYDWKNFKFVTNEYY